MAYNTIYRLMFTNDNNDDIIVHISDTTSGTGTTTYYDMECTAAALKVSNDGEDKRSVVRSLRLNFAFRSTNSFYLSLFTAGEDNRWKVEAYIQGSFNPAFFTGFLIPDGTQEMFLDPELFAVELTASDNLASIGEAPLRKPDGTVPKGDFRLIDYISWGLQKTFLQLPIKVVMNLREEHHTGADDAAFQKIFLEALSFEADINEREDFLTVIKKILGAFGCFITQVNSEWWIVRVGEMTGAAYRVYNFTYDGTYVNATTETKIKNIGIAETIQLVKEDATIFPERQIKYAKQKVRFETWQELICNINYTRGTLNATITSSLPSDYEAYNPVECWINGKNPHGSGYTAPDVLGYMRRIVHSGYEFERILVLRQSSYRPHYWQSETMDVNAKDKFTFSVDRKLSDDHTGSGWNNTSIFKIRLRGYDGSYWAMIGNATNGRIGSWKQGTGGFPVQSYDWIYQPDAEDESQWFTHSVDVDPCPVDGKVDFMLFQTNIYGDVSETHFSNIRIDYIPIIDGVYQKVTGQYHKVSNTDNRKANKDEEIFVSDMVNPNWKGNVKRFDGTNYILGGRWYDYNLGTTGGLGLERLGKWQDYDLWNQYNRLIRKFQGSLLGLDTDINELPSMVHNYVFTAPSDASTNKVYQLLTFDMDLATCEWSGTFSDVFDSVDGYDYGHDHEFKYTTQ
jgi:hypothetical protein